MHAFFKTDATCACWLKSKRMQSISALGMRRCLERLFDFWTAVSKIWPLLRRLGSGRTTPKHCMFCAILVDFVPKRKKERVAWLRY